MHLVLLCTLFLLCFYPSTGIYAAVSVFINSNGAAGPAPDENDPSWLDTARGYVSEPALQAAKAIVCCSGLIVFFC